MVAISFRDRRSEQRLFFFRVLQVVAGMLVLCGFLIYRWVDLQVVQHEHYSTLSQDNRVKLQPLPPARGLIYDRKGRILADNLPTFSLEIIPEKVEGLDETIAALGRIVPISEQDVKRFHRLRKQRRRFDSIPIRLQLTEEEVASFAINRHRFPGVDIEANLVRSYPWGVLTSHFLGYVGRINEQEMEVIDQSAYAGTIYMGKTGVEKFHEADLHGAVGVEQVEVNAYGRVARVLERQAPLAGNDLFLSVDLDLQRVATEAFGEETGAAVAIDPRDGSVLALVSHPGFDPNLFVEGISGEEYRNLQLDPNKPLFNRALRGQYPPGSTTKPFTALAGLELGAILPETGVYCPGYYRLPNQEHKYRCWKKWGHGTVSLYRAVVESCDVYFYDLALGIGVDRLHDFLARFSFGDRTGVDVAGEQTGLLPSREWKRGARRGAWFPGETLIMGIGQGYFMATPMQLANATATFGAKGLRYRPRLVERQRKAGSGEIESVAPELVGESSPFKQENWQAVWSGMVGVVEDAHGTAKHIRSEHFRIGGKTGTAQVFTLGQDETYNEHKLDKKMRDHALFVAFAPAEEPTIAVAVIVEHGGHGGSVAAPIAKQMMDYHFLGRAVQ